MKTMTELHVSSKLRMEAQICRPLCPLPHYVPFPVVVFAAASVLGSSRSSAQGITKITEIIDSRGVSAGNGLGLPWGIAVDAMGNVFVTGEAGNNAFDIHPDIKGDSDSVPYSVDFCPGTIL